MKSLIVAIFCLLGALVKAQEINSIWCYNGKVVRIDGIGIDYGPIPNTDTVIVELHLNDEIIVHNTDSVNVLCFFIPRGRLKLYDEYRFIMDRQFFFQYFEKKK